MDNVSNIFKRNKKILFLVLVILFLTAYGVSFAIVVASDAYKIAKEYVYNSKELNDRFGEIQQVNIAIGVKIGGGISHNRGKTKAHYKLNVFAAPDRHMVHIELEKIDGVWTVVRHKILE